MRRPPRSHRLIDTNRSTKVLSPAISSDLRSNSRPSFHCAHAAAAAAAPPTLMMMLMFLIQLHLFLLLQLLLLLPPLLLYPRWLMRLFKCCTNLAIHSFLFCLRFSLFFLAATYICIVRLAGRPAARSGQPPPPARTTARATAHAGAHQHSVVGRALNEKIPSTLTLIHFPIPFSRSWNIKSLPRNWLLPDCIAGPAPGQWRIACDTSYIPAVDGSPETPTSPNPNPVGICNSRVSFDRARISTTRYKVTSGQQISQRLRIEWATAGSFNRILSIVIQTNLLQEVHHPLSPDERTNSNPYPRLHPPWHFKLYPFDIFICIDVLLLQPATDQGVFCNFYLISNLYKVVRQMMTSLTDNISLL